MTRLDTSAARRGLLLGALGVVIFAMTLPMTRLAVGPVSDPQLPPLFVTAGRAAFAGLLSVLYLLATREGPGLRVADTTWRFIPASVVAVAGHAPGHQPRQAGITWEERRARPGVVSGTARTVVQVLAN